MNRIPWFRSWFGDEYLALYPHRDAAEAREAVALLKESGGHRPEDRVLDLACGGGRHLAELSRIGCCAVGLDLSIPLLRKARGVAPDANLVRGDMRVLPFATGAFDVVTSYFTSFGYFDEEGDDLRVLHEVRRVLRDGGCFLLDFLNAHQVKANLKSEDRQTVSGTRVVQERELVEGGRIVEKRITIKGEAGSDRVFVERVRLYEPGELDDMLREAQLVPGPRFGGYDAQPFDTSSTRYIVMGTAS